MSMMVMYSPREEEKLLFDSRDNERMPSFFSGSGNCSGASGLFGDIVVTSCHNAFDDFTLSEVAEPLNC
jgi:hypothetical protein